MKQKLLLIVVALLLSTLSLSAQEFGSNSRSFIVRDSLKLVRKERRAAIRAELMQTHSQFRLGMGFVPYFRSADGPGYYQSSPPMFSEPIDLIHKGILVWPISLEYTYRVVDFLEVGGSLGYRLLVNNQIFNRATGEALYNFSQWDLMVSVTARYLWFNSRWVSLYSSLGVWCYFRTDSYSGKVNRTTTNFGTAMVEFVPIGVRVGRRFFGFFEPVGISGRGMLLNFGLGYRF